MICRFAVWPGGLCLAALQVNEISHVDSFSLFGPLRSVIHKRGFTLREEADRGQCPPHSLFLQHHLLKVTPESCADYRLIVAFVNDEGTPL